jgi:hypothetical protein
MMASTRSISDPSGVEVSEPATLETLFDNLEIVESDVSGPPSREDEDRRALREYEDDDAKRRGTTPEQLALAADGRANLTLPHRSVARATEAKRAFERAGSESEVGERLLEELVSAELAVALELQNTEGALVALLQKTITDPTLGTAVTKLTREVIGLSDAVRHRIHGSLGAGCRFVLPRRSSVVGRSERASSARSAFTCSAIPSPLPC